MTDKTNTNSQPLKYYANNRDEWPDKDLWDCLAADNDGKQPADDMRCQHIASYDFDRCGLAHYAKEEGEPRCIFHHSANRDLDDLREQLEAAVSSITNLAEANLREANLAEANLSGAILWDANLSGARLIGANLSGANLWGANLSGARFIGAQLTGNIDLRQADLQGARFLASELSPEAKLDAAQWGEGGIVQDEIDARSKDDRDDRRWSFGACAAIYRQIKLSYQHSGDYQTAGHFFIREMECRRFALAAKGPPTAEHRGPLRRSWNWLSHYATRALWCLSYYTCQHAENPGRLLGIMALLVVLFGGIHSLSGVVDNTQGTTDQPHYVLAPGWGLDLSGHPFVQLGKALYFSVVTFTCLGYGDVRPAQGWGQFVTCVEVVLGVILIALFVGCIIRKVSR